MSSEQSNTPAKRRGMLWHVSRYLLAVFGISLIAGAPPEAEAAIAQRALEVRIEKVREAIKAAETAEADHPEKRKVVQWWPNWGNWPNWPNWGNWFNR